jgi:hypothetical protein
MIGWIKCLIEPVKWLYHVFKTNRNSNLYLLAHNGQVGYLEAVLNDTFDMLNRRIFISDPLFFDPGYIYLETELKPLHIGLVSDIGVSVFPTPNPVPLYTDSELYSGGGISFIVNVPIALALTVTPGPIKRLKALVDMYKLPGRRYDVVFF